MTPSRHEKDGKKPSFFDFEPLKNQSKQIANNAKISRKMSLKIQNVVNILGIIKELGHAIYKMVKSEKDKKSKEQDAATV